MPVGEGNHTYPDPQYDAFVAHSSEDRDAVEELIETLESRGVRCFDPDRDFLLGELVIKNMAQAVAISRKTITYLSKNFLNSACCEKERGIAEQKAMDTRENVIVDILVDLDKTTLPRWLQITTYVKKSSPDFLPRLLQTLGVSNPEERADKAYEDLMQENMSLKEEQRMMNNKYRELEQANLAMAREKHTLEREKQSLEREKQSLEREKQSLEREREKQSLEREKQSWEREKQSLTNQLQNMKLSSQSLQEDYDSPQTETKRLWQRENETGQSEIVSADLHQAKQQKLDNTEIQEKMEVQPTISFPAHWEDMFPEEGYREVGLERWSKEWQEVRKMVKRTAGGVGGDILVVSRIQNPTLYQAYQRKKWEMSHQDPDRQECTLYYGTTGLAECKAIMENGFQKGTRNKVSKPYGNGIYFMSTSKTALEASATNSFFGWNYKYIIVAKVLPGRCVKVRPNTTMQTNEQYVSADSVVDNVDNPSVVLTQDPSQAYPEYLIIWYYR